MQSGFIPVFEQKLEKLISKLKKELDLPKKDRNKDNLKRMIREAKDLRKLIKQYKVEADPVCCPNCGCVIV